jgi:hypothetical protein
VTPRWLRSLAGAVLVIVGFAGVGLILGLALAAILR